MPVVKANLTYQPLNGYLLWNKCSERSPSICLCETIFTQSRFTSIPLSAYLKNKCLLRKVNVLVSSLLIKTDSEMLFEILFSHLVQ